MSARATASASALTTTSRADRGQRLLDGAQVAAAQIGDDDATRALTTVSVPLVDGTPTTRGSSRAAARGRARERLEQRLDHVVRVLAVADLEVQVAQRGADEAAEELAPQLGVERPDPPALERVGAVHERRAAAEVDRRRHQRLVHRDRRLAVAADAAPVAERLAERLAQAEADVLDGVVGVDLDVAGRR